MTRALVVVGLLVLSGCASAPPPKPLPGGPLTVSLPIWSTDQKHSFADDRGHIVVIDAWATWCAPCKAQLPELDALAKQWAGQGVRVYAVSIDTDVNAIGPFLLTMRIDLPILLDPGAAVLTPTLGLQDMPTTWVIDQGGQVVLAEHGSTIAAVNAKVNLMLASPARP